MKAFDYQPEFNKTTLNNGVRIITEHHPYTRTTCVGFFVDLGSRDEPDHLIGSAHFLEHVLFKGTKTRSAYDIVSELESIGGEINAFTAKEYTSYHASTLREHKNVSLSVLSDMMMNAACSLEDFDRERKVILQEIDMSKDVLEEHIFDIYFERAYENHPLGQPILGTEQSLYKMNHEQLFSFYNQRYHGPHLIISVAGDVHHQEVVENLKELENLRKPQVKHVERRPPVMNHFWHSENREAEQLHMLMGLPSCSFNSDSRFEAYIVSAALGGASTSQLYQKIREQKGLAYNVYSHLQSFTDSGALLIYVGTSPELSDECLSLIHNELIELKTKGLSFIEIEYYKTQVMGQIMMASDDIENRMNSIAINEMVFGGYRPVEHTLEEIERVNHKSIEKYLNQYLNFDSIGFMAMGKGAEKAVDFARGLFAK